MVLQSAGTRTAQVPLTNKTLVSWAVLVNTKVADVRRASDLTSGPPDEIVNTLNDSDPEQLRDAATCAEALAEHEEREERPEESAEQEAVEERPDNLPDGASHSFSRYPLSSGRYLPAHLQP